MLEVERLNPRWCREVYLLERERRPTTLKLDATNNILALLQPYDSQVQN